jgi:hypothetical protein
MPRLAVCAVLFAASCLLVAQRAEPLAAQEKKDKNTLAALEKQVAALKQDLQAAAQLNNALKVDVVQREKQNVALRQEVAVLKQEVSVLKKEVGVLKTTNGRLNSIIKKENIALPAADQTIANLQTTIDGYRGAGLVHVVVLKLKSDSSAGEAQSVIDDTYAQLAKIKTVRGVWAGKPAAKPTPGAASDYTVALVFVFDNTDGLKSYLNDAAHTKFADKHLKKWEAPLVYDFEPKKPAAP